MKIAICAVGRVRPPLAEAVAEYEDRAARYFSLRVEEVKEGKGRGGSVGAVRQAEGRGLLERVPSGFRILALTPEGARWRSERLARELSGWALHAVPGAAFLIGGAFGLSDEVLETADDRLSLSAMTLPHELARLVLAEQLYRAGTIQRGEPYHKSRNG